MSVLRLMSADMDPEVLPEATTFSTMVIEFRDCIGFPLGDLLVIQSPQISGRQEVLQKHMVATQ